MRSEINLAIWKAFQAEGINVPFPQRVVRVVNMRVWIGNVECGGSRCLKPVCALCARLLGYGTIDMHWLTR